jgi:hypothetical protein
VPILAVSEPTAIKERFEKKVDRSPGLGPNGDCWEWAAGKSSQGYGKLWVNTGLRCGKHIGAHRLAYEFYVGPIPDGMLVCHRCDNPPCVNPSHLFLGTDQENVQDCINKGRWPKYRPIGELNPSATLKEFQVIEILELWSKGNITKGCLAKKIGTTWNIVDSIVERRKWKHVSIGRLKGESDG